MEEENKILAAQFYSEVVNKGEQVAMEKIVSVNFVDHYAPPTAPQGIVGLKQFLKMVSTAFPDIQVAIEEMIAEKNKVAVRLTVTGTQTGVLMGTIPPGGKHAVWTGIDIIKVENGKITDRWVQRDLLSMMRQIGAIPA